MNPATHPKSVQDCHDLLAWIIPVLDKFPRARRFTLGERLEEGLLDVLEIYTTVVLRGSVLHCRVEFCK